MNREEAFVRASRAKVQIMVAAGALILASLNTTKVIRYLQGVTPRDKVLSNSTGSPQDTKEALENMVEAYSEQVN